MCFFDNLKKCRQQKNLSQKEIAELIGVAPSTYSLYESGKREPDVEKLKLISKVLCVSADYLLFGVENTHTLNKEFELFDKLDVEDRAEIRGEMKQMLKADKYSNAPTVSDDIAEELTQNLLKDTIHTK